MIAMRSASVMNDTSEAGIDAISEEIAQSVLELSVMTSPAHYLRSQIACGLNWVNLELIPHSIQGIRGGV